MQSTKLTPSELISGSSLAIVYVLRMLGLFMVIPVIAVAATEFPDYSPLLVGIAVGGYGLTQAILQIPMGMASDKFGRKKVIYLGLLMFALGSLIAGLSESLTGIVFGRILQGAGAIAGAVMALASDVTRESQRTKIMALIGISIGFSFYIALIAGPIITAAYGMQGVFLITAVLAIACFPLIKFGVTDAPMSVSSQDATPKAGQLSTLFKHRYLLRLNILVLVLHLLITCFFIQVPQLLTDIGVPLSEHYQVYGVVLLASILGLMLLMRLSSLLPIGNLFSISFLLLAISFVGITQNPDYFYLIAIGTLFFSGFNFLEAKMPSMVSSIAPPGQKGSAMGIYASFQFFGAFLGGVVSGLMNQYFQSKLVAIVCLILIFASSLVARGLSSVEKVKRISLEVEQDLDDHQLLLQKLEKILALEGVKDAHLDIDEKVFHLKVDTKTFQLSNAQTILTS